jgi:hypothetical protein
MTRLVPPHVLAAPPLDAEAIVPTLYDPEEFAALYHADKDRALALVAAMTAPQRVRQALAYAAWLAYHGLVIDLATVLAAWREREVTMVAALGGERADYAPALICGGGGVLAEKHRMDGAFRRSKVAIRGGGSTCASSET